MLFRTRDLLVCRRTQTINALRGRRAEFGIAAPQGAAHVARLAQALGGSGIAGLAKEFGEATGCDDDAARLTTIPGVGPVTTIALRACAPPLESFRRRWDFAA